MTSVLPPRYALGVDYGTNSVRAVIFDTADGKEIGAATWAYAHGEHGVIVDDRDPNVARQHPADYHDGFVHSVAGAVKAARAHPAFDPALIVGIGVDATGSTPLPVDENGVALGLHERFSQEPAAMAWLWKDHTSHAEAAEITEKASKMGLPYLAKCGGVYSSEWYWSKALRCERTRPAVAKAAFAWVEMADYIPGMLTGRTDPRMMSRGICAAGHKAMYHTSWGGLPSAAFLDGLSPGFSRYRERFASRAVSCANRAGELIESIAAKCGLPAGIPVAVGGIDAHMGAVGAGVGPGTLVKIMGTSTCDCMVAPLSHHLPDIPGVCGIVPESILPGMHGIEAGQSAVGDIFNWFAQSFAPGDGADAHATLTAAAAKLRPGESGLISLDWHNGNRTVLVDPLLTGMVVGQTLRTTPAETYRALIEATAFGALKIIERIEQYGVSIDRVVNCGGIAEKNPLVMQIYADVCNRPMLISRSPQTCALGAAIFGAVVGGAHVTVPEAQWAMTGVRPEIYRPIAANVDVYRKLNAIYTTLHDAFGTSTFTGSLAHVMKDLIRIRSSVRTTV